MTKEERAELLANAWAALNAMREQEFELSETMTELGLDADPDLNNLEDALTNIEEALTRAQGGG